MPDGKIVDRDFVHHSGAVVVLPVLADGSIVMIRNYRFAVGETLWELPAGLLETGENQADCAGRELIEETGFKAGKIEKLGQFYTCPGIADENMHAFLATDLMPGEQDLETYEQITVEILSEQKVRDMLLDGTIHDGKTIATLGLYWLKRGK